MGVVPVGSFKKDFRWASHAFATRCKPSRGIKEKGPAKGTLKDHKDKKKGSAKETLKDHKDQRKKTTLNPKTKKPFCKETIYDIFETECYDVDPLAPWVNKARLSQKTCNQQPQTHDRREVE